MTEKVQLSCGNTSTFGLLGVLFVGLKLGGVIDWSWWWVTLPFWGGLALALGIAVLMLVLAGIAGLLGAIFNKPKKNRRWRR